MRAIISDIHGNIEALETVLDWVSSAGVDEIWCLGDLVGYGPNPRECVDLIQEHTSLCLMGNHDWALLNKPLGFSSLAARMIEQTRKWMGPEHDSSDEATRRWRFLEKLPKRLTESDFNLVHASPRHALTEYIMPHDVKYDKAKFPEIFSLIDKYCLIGHTHHPCAITEKLELIVPEGDGFEVPLQEQKMIINVGSVGQPRDGDSRLCFVTISDSSVRYHRLPYDFRRTRQKLYGLDNELEVLGDRLVVGR